jgi:dsRNA-specific ribonuclease
MSGSKRILVLRMKARWWDEIASGSKSVELRLQTEYWRKRLIGREYDEIHLWKGYPPKTQTQLLLRRKWASVVESQVVHEEFGPKPVAVFCIDVSESVERN